MPMKPHHTIDTVIIGDGRMRSFLVGHAFTTIAAVRVVEAGDREVAVEVAYPSPAQVAIIFDSPPAVGKPFIVYLSGS